MDKKIVVLGVDLSKAVFQCHGVNATSQRVCRKKLTKTKLLGFVSNIPKCTIVMEACGGAHYLARKFQEFGHEAKLIAPQYVNPFVKTNKDDGADAEAIVEAASRPNMHYVPIKQIWQQDLQSIERVRERLIKNKTALTNEIRGLLFEYGIVIPKGDSVLTEKMPKVLASDNDAITETAKSVMLDLFSEFFEIKEKILNFETKLANIVKKDPNYKKLDAIKGVGMISIAALIIALADPKVFKNGRHFAAWLGLVPKHSGTGGKNKNLGISKRGDSYMRKILIHGARSAVHAVNMKAEKDKNSLDPLEKWIFKLYQAKGTNLAAVALANKNARIAWALMAHNKKYDVNLASHSPLKVAA